MNPLRVMVSACFPPMVRCRMSATCASHRPHGSVLRVAVKRSEVQIVCVTGKGLGRHTWSRRLAAQAAQKLTKSRRDALGDVGVHADADAWAAKSSPITGIRSRQGALDPLRPPCRTPSGREAFDHLPPGDCRVMAPRRPGPRPAPTPDPTRALGPLSGYVPRR